MPNLDSGIYSFGAGVTYAFNVISGNAAANVEIDDPGTSGNVVSNNEIGTDITGSQAIDNTQPYEIAGIDLENGASGDTISGNVISGNHVYGIDLEDLVNNIDIFGNMIGVEGMADSLAMARTLVLRHGVAVAPGSAFREAGEGWLRVCFAHRGPRLERAMQRLRDGLKATV